MTGETNKNCWNTTKTSIFFFLSRLHSYMLYQSERTEITSSIGKFNKISVWYKHNIHFTIKIFAQEKKQIFEKGQNKNTNISF